MDKPIVLQACREQVLSKYTMLKEELNSLKESNSENDKSSAGDKYETERSMVHQEMDKLLNQIDIENRVLVQLREIDPESVYSSVKCGSIVETNRGTFLLGASCGKVTVNGAIIFGVSMESPLAVEMSGKRKGESFQLNGNDFSILAVI